MVTIISLQEKLILSHGYDKMYMDKYLIEDKLYQSVDQFHGKKLIIEIFILHYLTIYIRFTMGMKEPVRYYLLHASSSSLNSTIKLEYCIANNISRVKQVKISFEKVGTIIDIFGLGVT